MDESLSGSITLIQLKWSIGGTMNKLPIKPLLLSLILVFLCLGISGCKSQGVYSSIVENPCSPPCWQEIIPGVTTSGEAIAIINSIPLVDSGTIETQKANQYHFENQIFWEFLDRSYGGASLTNDIVVEIRFEELSIPLEKLITVFGDPHQIVFYPRWGDDWYINLIYPEQGVWFWYYKHQTLPRKIEIRPQDLVKRVMFVDPQILMELLAKDGQLYLEAKSLTVGDLLVPWEDYGKVAIP